MASITKLKTAQSIRNFEPRAALALSQAFQRHLDLEPLLAALFSQAEAIVEAVGLQYRNPGRGIDLFSGTRGSHTASYNLSYQDEDLGELVCHFHRRVTEEVLETAEDLIALAMAPLRNALRYLAACQGRPEAEPDTGHADSLLLLKLDDFAAVRLRDGDEWAQTLLESVKAQIHAGLRGTDAVFQIDPDTLAVLLAKTEPADAEQVAGKLRVLIGSLHLRDGRVTRQLTACMGIAGSRSADLAQSVLEEARGALAEAELRGPNCIVCRPPVSVP